MKPFTMLSQTEVPNKLTINFKNKQIDIDLKQDVNGTPNSIKLLLNATQIFKALDLPPSQEPDKWLRLNDTKHFIIANSTRLSEDARKEELSTLFYSNHTKRMKRLAPMIEDEFTIQQKGRIGGTFMVKELFLKYMAYLDKDLEWKILEVFSKYGHLDRLKGNAKTHAILEIAANSVSDTIEQNTKIKPTKERTLARLDGMVKQRSLVQILCSILCNQGFIKDKELSEEFFRRVYIGIYEGCFGQTKEDILELLERKSGLIRDYMSDDALDILNMAETTIHVQLSLAKRAGIDISWDFIYETIIDSCKIASSIPFKYTDKINFLHREPNRKFKKQIDVTLSNDMSITKVSKKIL